MLIELTEEQRQDLNTDSTHIELQESYYVVDVVMSQKPKIISELELKKTLKDYGGDLVKFEVEHKIYLDKDDWKLFKNNFLDDYSKLGFEKYGYTDSEGVIHGIVVASAYTSERPFFVNPEKTNYAKWVGYSTGTVPY